MLNELYALTPKGETCTIEMIDLALNNIISAYESTYQDRLTLLSAKQVALLKAICKEKKVAQITAGKFIKNHHLDSASSVQKASKALIEKQIITQNAGIYEPYDKFMEIWIQNEN